MPQSEQQLTEMYRRNLAYFRRHHPDVHAKITNLPQPPRYSLVLRKNRYFDIGHAATRRLVYQSDPAEQAAQSLEFILNTPGNYLAFRRSEDISKNLDLRVDALNRVEAYCAAHRPGDGMRHAPRKIICFGAGVGTHIRRFAEIEPLQAMLIVEPNREFLRFSSFFVDYGEIEKRIKLFFAVDDDLYEPVFAFLEHSAGFNFSTKLFLLLAEYQHLVADAQLCIAGYFDFSVEQRLIQARNTIRNRCRHPLLDFPSERVTPDVRVLLLASGPSLETRMDFIKQARDRFLVCCVGSCLAKLLRNGIAVDVCFSLDPGAHIVDQFQDVPSEALETICFVASMQSDAHVTGAFARTYLVENTENAGATVAHFSLYVLCRLGFTEIYVIGVDAALSEDLEEYSSEVVQHRLETGHKTFEVPGNLRKTVTTNEKLAKYIRAYGSVAGGLRQGTIYNVSDGALLDGLRPMRPEDVALAEFPPASKDKLPLWFRPQDKPPPDTLLLSDRDTDHSDSLMHLIRQHKRRIDERRLDLGSIDEFIEFRTKSLLADFSRRCGEDKRLAAILDKYLFTGDWIIFSLLDHKNLRDFSRHSEHLYREWLAGLEDVVGKYIGFLQQK